MVVVVEVVVVVSVPPATPPSTRRRRRHGWEEGCVCVRVYVLGEDSPAAPPHTASLPPAFPLNLSCISSTYISTFFYYFPYTPHNITPSSTSFVSLLLFTFQYFFPCRVLLYIYSTTLLTQSLLHPHSPLPSPSLLFSSSYSSKHLPTTTTAYLLLVVLTF